VWTLTDNYSRYDVINHLISRDSHGNTWHPVRHDHCNKVKAILEKLGIPHRLWYSDKEYEKKTEEYDNSSYTGEFRHGERHGRGKYTWKDGISCEGEWKNGKMNGEGVKIFQDGGKYIGKFEDGREVGGWYHFQGARGRGPTETQMGNELLSTRRMMQAVSPHRRVLRIGLSQKQ
jgi:hypothetical protein